MDTLTQILHAARRLSPDERHRLIAELDSLDSQEQAKKRSREPLAALRALAGTGVLVALFLACLGGAEANRQLRRQISPLCRTRGSATAPYHGLISLVIHNIQKLGPEPFFFMARKCSSIVQIFERLPSKVQCEQLSSRHPQSW
jgi:hypothetical protein